MDLPTAPVPASGFLVTHFLTVADQVRSREFYVGVLGGTALTSDSPCVIKLVNSWVILNGGGGPTPDKPGGQPDARCAGVCTVTVQGQAPPQARGPPTAGAARGRELLVTSQRRAAGH